MKIKYSPHARKRLAQRKIKPGDVEMLIHRPDSIVSADRNRQIARKKIKDKILEIIFVEENNQIVIITLYNL